MRSCRNWPSAIEQRPSVVERQQRERPAAMPQRAQYRVGGDRADGPDPPGEIARHGRPMTECRPARLSRRRCHVCIGRLRLPSLQSPCNRHRRPRRRPGTRAACARPGSARRLAGGAVCRTRRAGGSRRPAARLRAAATRRLKPRDDAPDRPARVSRPPAPTSASARRGRDGHRRLRGRRCGVRSLGRCGRLRAAASSRRFSGGNCWYSCHFWRTSSRFSGGSCLSVLYCSRAACTLGRRQVRPGAHLLLDSLLLARGRASDSAWRCPATSACAGGSSWFHSGASGARTCLISR